MMAQFSEDKSWRDYRDVMVAAIERRGKLVQDFADKVAAIKQSGDEYPIDAMGAVTRETEFSRYDAQEEGIYSWVIFNHLDCIQAGHDKYGSQSWKDMVQAAADIRCAISYMDSKGIEWKPANSMSFAEWKGQEKWNRKLAGLAKAIGKAEKERFR